MSVGNGALLAGLSYLSFGREMALGTGVTATAGIDFLSSSLKTMKETKILEQVARSRTHSKQISMGKKIEGDLEFYYQPQVEACNYMLQNAFGGTVTSATATGETVGGVAFEHEFLIGSMDQTYKSLSANNRKGPLGTGIIWEYVGLRVNEITFTAELDEALKTSVSFIGIDSTQTANDVESALTISSALPLSFVNGRISIENSFASLTSSSYWNVQSVEFGISNSLKSDNDSRRIGSDILQVLTPGMASMPLSMTIRFDTTTAYEAMINATQLTAELEFQGETLAGSVVREGIKFQFPKIFINESGEPEISGPDEILKSEISLNVLQDDASAAGYAIKAIVTNLAAAY